MCCGILEWQIFHEQGQANTSSGVSTLWVEVTEPAFASMKLVLNSLGCQDGVDEDAASFCDGCSCGHNRDLKRRN